MRMTRRAALAATWLPTALAAQEPGRTVTLVVPFPPGGQADLAARPLAPALERALRAPVIVQNRGGAAGAIGNAVVARAPGDGTTLLMALSSLAVIPEAERLFARTPPYEVAQLAPIALINADPTMLAVPVTAPWRTLEDFVTAARNAPGTIPYGSSGAYGTLHVAMEMLASGAGIRLLHVPFTGAGPAITALLSGNIQALASAPGTLTGHVRDNRLRVLACWGRTRAPAFPDVPTLAERGYPDAEFYIWAGLFAPATTPDATRQRLRDAVRIAVADPDLLRAYDAAGAPLAYLDAPDFETFFRDDSARLVRAVARIGRVE